MNVRSIKLKISEWLVDEYNIRQLKRILNSTAFLIFIAAHLPFGELSLILYWIAVIIAIYATYLNWKYD